MDSLLDAIPSTRRSRYDVVAEDLQRERQAYLHKVSNGRRVARADPSDPRFSQHADDERQARMAGLGEHLPFRAGQPRTMAQAPAREESLFDALLSAPIEQAQRQMQMTPQERALYERHLENLNGPGKVTNQDGSISTLFQMSVEGPGGKVYNIPSVYDGQIVPPAVAIDRAARYGWNFFPSYKDTQTAESRYRQMHPYMDQDVGRYKRKSQP